MSTYLLRS